MPLAYRTEENNPLVLALCQDTAVWEGLNLDVDERDEMLGFFLDILDRDRDRALAMYFQSGLLLWETLRTALAWRFGNDLDRIGKLLDFASGYGRVTRFIVQDVPPERVWVSDIYADGVRFQEERFDVHGLLSTVDPADFHTAERFDAILVSSLFTHLPEATFHGWLRRLWSLLAPGGVLLFSVHDPSLLWPARDLPASGILFQAVSESGSLDKSQYGSSWVSEDFVRRALAAIAPDASAHRIPRGLVNFQDLWVAVDQPGVDFAGLPVRAQPEGYLEHCSFTPPDLVRLRGWVIDRVRRAPVREVQAAVGDQVLARVAEFSPREDAAHLFPEAPLVPQGWSMDLHLPRGTSRSTAVLKIRAVDAAGEDSVLYAATLDAALQRSTSLDLLATRAELASTRAERDSLSAYVRQLGWERHVLETRLAAMEASRFWRLREQWFALKRRLRLTDQP